MRELEVVRAVEEWQRAGAYSVRIQGMNRQHHISLREEFDEHDGDDAKYIILLDDGYPVATCRIYPVDGECAKVGRVVVLPEYRGKHLGSKVICEAERWIGECGFREVAVDARDVAVGFYEKLGYEPVDGTVFKSGPFACVYMRKRLPAKGEEEVE